MALPGTARPPAHIGPEFYSSWRNYIQFTTGLTGSRLTQATQNAMRQAESSGAATRLPSGTGGPTGQTGTTGPTGQTGPTGPGNDNYQPVVSSANEYLNGLLKNALGVDGLGDWAAGLYNRGASVTEIVQALRYGLDKSPEGQAAYQKYLAAFPGMDKFLADGIFAGESPELQYIEYRNNVRESAARYGIDPMLVSNEKIVNYLTNKVSAAEIAQRMGTAANAVATTPSETIAILKDYYGVSSGDLITFFLNPEETEAMLQTRYTAARIGTEGARQQFGVNALEAEALAKRGIGIEQAAEGFRTAAERRSFMAGPGETAGEKDLLGASFGEQRAEEKIFRIAASRSGRFQEGGRFTEGQGGGAALGSATTR
jgi:hypothetical protein